MPDVDPVPMMSPTPESARPISPAEAAQNEAIQREIRQGREFSLADVIAQEGGSFMKGESPIPPLHQAIAAIHVFIAQHLNDPAGALRIVLQTWVTDNEAQISANLDQPLLALQASVQRILDTPELLYELVRQADMKWGELYDERPHFQQPGQSPHPDDEYTHESVRQTLHGFGAEVTQAVASAI